MKELSELIDEFCQQEKIYRFEGESGLQNINKVCEALGYRATGFRFGTNLEVFLTDNPGAVEAILEWINEQNDSEWRNNIESELESEESEDG